MTNNEMIERKAKALALLTAFEILHRYFMKSANTEVMNVLKKAQKDILNLL